MFATMDKKEPEKKSSFTSKFGGFLKKVVGIDKHLSQEEQEQISKLNFSRKSSEMADE